MIDPIKHYSIQNVPNIFDEEAMTVLELCGRLGFKTNEIIKKLNKHCISIGDLTKAIKNIDNHMQGIAETLGELAVEPLGFATPQMFGATGDGVADDTQAIKAAIQSLSDHNAVLYFPPGTYLVSEDINLKSNMTVKGAGESSVIRRAGNNLENYRVFRCVELTNVYISDLAIHGDKMDHIGTSGEWGMCISLEGSMNVNIERCYLHDGWGDGVYIGSYGDTYKRCDYVNIRDCHIVGNRRNGISVINVSGLIIDGCLISTTKDTEPGAGIDFEPNNNLENILDVKVTNCTFTGNEKDILFADTAGKSLFNASVLISGCVFQSKVGLYWHTSYDEEYGIDAGCFVRVKNCEFHNSYRCVQIIKHPDDKPLSFENCDFSSTSLCLEIGGSTYNDSTALGGIRFYGCHIQNNGEQPAIRIIGKNATVRGVEVDLTIHAGQKFAYINSVDNTPDVKLNFNGASVRINTETTFNQYNIPTKVFVDPNGSNITDPVSIYLDGKFPFNYPFELINFHPGGLRVYHHDHSNYALIGAGEHKYFEVTETGCLAW